jgi:hypothetical protein
MSEFKARRKSPIVVESIEDKPPKLNLKESGEVEVG